MSPRNVVRFGVALLSLVLVAGCRNGALTALERSVPVPVAPASPLAAVTNGPVFYPLELGNHWLYARTFDVSWVDATGTPQGYHLVSSLVRELMCETPVGSRSYLAERTMETPFAGIGTSWAYYRQDRNGLYEADEPTPPPCAPPPPPEVTVAGRRAHPLSGIAERGKQPDDPGMRAAVATLEQRLALVRYTLGLPAPSLRRPRPAPGEIVRLAYPLHAGQEWIIRGEPRFTATVEGLDVLHVPAGSFIAYRIRIESVLFGPKDRVRVWYGRQGFLKLEFHGESAGLDEAGNPIGTVTSDDHEVLDGIALVNGQPG